MSARTAGNYDFSVHTDGIALLYPQTEEANMWVVNNVNLEEVAILGSGIPVEMCYIEDICTGILNDGLSIEKDGLEMYLGEEGELLLREMEAVSA